MGGLKVEGQGGATSLNSIPDYLGKGLEKAAADAGLSQQDTQRLKAALGSLNLPGVIRDTDQMSAQQNKIWNLVDNPNLKNIPNLKDVVANLMVDVGVQFEQQAAARSRAESMRMMSPPRINQMPSLPVTRPANQSSAAQPAEAPHRNEAQQSAQAARAQDKSEVNKAPASSSFEPQGVKF